MDVINERGLENLCNAVIIQAARDYRACMGYLKKHPRTPELEAKVESDRALRKEKMRKLVEAEKEYMAERAFKRWVFKHDEGEEFDRNAYMNSIRIQIPKNRFPPTKDELLLEKIERNEREAAEIERFFLSKWYTVLTDVDGGTLLKKLREEFADESD